MLDLVDEDIAGNDSLTAGASGDRLEFVSTPVLAASGARGDSGNYRGPGIWYVSLYLPTNKQKPARVEVPVEFELDVIGEPQPDASPEPTPAEATPAPAEEQDDSGGGSSLVAVIGVGLVCVLVGLVGGAVLGRRRPRPA